MKNAVLWTTVSLLSANIQAQGTTEDALFSDTEAPVSVKAPPLDKLQFGGQLEILSEKTGSDVWTTKTAQLYVDSRLNEESRIFLRYRLSEQTGREVMQDIDEAWLKWVWNESLFLTYGKQHVKWGSGVFWNPTDFTAKEVKNPLDTMDRRLGQDMVKLHYPSEKINANFYLVLLPDGVAARSEWMPSSTAELSVSAVSRKDGTRKLGIDLSIGLSNVDVRTEVAGIQAEDGPKLQTVVAIERSWKTGDSHSLVTGLEYFDNEYQRSEVLYQGRRYLGGYIILPKIGNSEKLRVQTHAIQNIEDKSHIARLSMSYDAQDALRFQFYGDGCKGVTGELCNKKRLTLGTGFELDF